MENVAAFQENTRLLAKSQRIANRTELVTVLPFQEFILLINNLVVVFFDAVNLETRQTFLLITEPTTHMLTR